MYAKRESRTLGNVGETLIESTNNCIQLLGLFGPGLFLRAGFFGNLVINDLDFRG